MNYEKVDLSDIARKIIGALQNYEPSRKVNVNISRDIIAYGDRVLLGQVLENLLGNAWKFTSKIPESRIEMGVIEKDGKQTYFVRDNGAGFNMEHAGRLFKPFQRLHAASDFPGTGIGLAIVQQIVRRHGGEVRAEGKVGEGAAFYFTLS
jgi:light-regulated signal transduction histidine kinase (bacteriophytochrome)